MLVREKGLSYEIITRMFIITFNSATGSIKINN